MASTQSSAPGDAAWPGWSPWRSSLIFGAAALFVFFQMVLQTFPSVMREGLVVDLSLNEAGFGGLSSSFYYPYILLQIPAGILVSRFGARSVLIGGALLCTVASFLFAMSHTANAAELTRILMGFGAAPTVVCAMALAAQWFPRRLFPILAASTEVFGMVGAALGQETLGFIVEGVAAGAPVFIGASASSGTVRIPSPGPAGSVSRSASSALIALFMSAGTSSGASLSAAA